MDQRERLRLNCPATVHAPGTTCPTCGYHTPASASRAPGQWEYHRPIFAGLYWWQPDERSAPRIAEVEFSALHERWFVRTMSGVLRDIDIPVPGRWLGPLAPPSGLSPWPQSHRPTSAS
jgi:hypothetical protein